MKTKCRNRTWGWPALLACLLALVLAAGPALAATGGGRLYPAPVAAGQALDWDKDCALTVRFPHLTDADAQAWDLPQQDTLVDLYQMAYAVPLAGYDVYGYCVSNAQPWYSLVKTYVQNQPDWTSTLLTAAPYIAAGTPAAGEEEDAGQETAGTAADDGATEWLLFYYAPADPDTASVDGWTGLEDALAGALFGPEPLAAPAQPGDAPTKENAVPVRTTVGQQQGGLAPGLYLTVVHGDIPQYTVGQPAPDAPEVTQVRTIAYTDTRLYTFQPQLISLPGLGVNEQGGTLANTAANPGSWVYSAEVYCKPSHTPRYASLEVQKTLATYAQPVTFVFRVVARDPDAAPGAAPVYERVIPISFTGAGTSQPVRLDNVIPVGCDVTVTEEYAGAVYTLTGQNVTTRPNGSQPATPYTSVETTADGSIVIRGIRGGTVAITTPAGEELALQTGTTVTAGFTNDTTDTPNGGGSVVNIFTPDAENGWTWSRRTYNAATGQWETEVMPSPQA